MPEPSRPSITPAQIVAVLIAGVPALAKLLAAFGVYTLSAAQQDALTGALTWLGVLAGVLVASDAALRSARNAAHAKVATKAAPAAITSVPRGAVYAESGTTGSNVITTWTQPPVADEPGDPDALPDYATDENVPPDEGDTSANGNVGERES